MASDSILDAGARIAAVMNGPAGSFLLTAEGSQDVAQFIRVRIKPEYTYLRSAVPTQIDGIEVVCEIDDFDIAASADRGLQARIDSSKGRR